MSLSESTISQLQVLKDAGYTSKLIKFLGIVLLSSSLVVLSGCGSNSLNQTVVDMDRLQALEVEALVKLSDISDGDWDYVCVLTPYSGGVSDHGNDLNNRIGSKISKLNLSISGSNWHFLFEKDGVVVADSFRRSNRLDIEQKHFDAMRTKILDLYSFEPNYCVEFPQAVIYKFKKSERNYVVLGELQE
jgi:hypothetical protein